MLKRNWDPVATLYLQEAMLLLKYNIAKEFSQRDLAVVLLGMLKDKEQLDENSLEFLNILQAGRPIEELRLALME